VEGDLGIVSMSMLTLGSPLCLPAAIRQALAKAVVAFYQKCE
jgi:hypothetical protein